MFYATATYPSHPLLDESPQSLIRCAMRKPTAPEAPPMNSESLLKGQKMVEIVHNGSLYKLQATKLGKLILTK